MYKRQGQSYVHFALLCFVEREVQAIVDVFVVITIFVVDGRRNNCLLYTSLGMKHITYDARELFRSRIIRYFVEEYLSCLLYTSFPMATGRRVEEQTLIYRGKEEVKANNDTVYRDVYKRQRLLHAYLAET